MLLQLAERVQSAPTDQAIVRALLPLATNRRFAVVVILTLCIVTPIIEEALKPVAVWFGATRIIAPAQGFALGALCGAGFATFESLMAVATVGSDWWKLVVLRAGTDVMHTANAALMGWALVAAWRERRYLRLALVYAAVIFIHGSWNLLAISYGLSTLPTAVEGIAINLNFQASYALPGLALISILMLALLFYMNRRLSRPAYSRLTETEDPSAGHNLQV